jgi:fatty-acyl-CoA synthase
MSEAAVQGRWLEHAERTPEREAIVHWVAGEEPVRLRWGELVLRAGGHADRLRAAGVRAGDVCALVIRHHADFFPLYMGAAFLGALPAVLAYPNARLHPDKFRTGLAGMAERSGLDWVLTERELDPLIRPLATGAKSTIRGVLFPLEAERLADVAPPGPPDGGERPFLLQHSSGTTGLQKAVVLSHRAVLEHVDRYARAVGLSASDRVVSWLPLYHDMGLIAAMQMSLARGAPLVQMSPFEWVSAPVLLLQALSSEGGTLSWLPNFAYNLTADRVHEDDMEGVRLDRVRMLVNCSEPVRAESHERFARRLAPFGLRREALAACYAMAETTFAVTQTAPGVEARRLVVDREELGRGRAAPAPGGRACVSSGRPIDGCEVRIEDEAGRALGEGAVGEIAVRSVSLFDGYRNDPARTAEVLRDGWYLTRDYGFFHEGEIYVVGRKKDLIIVAGKNVYPEDVEDAVAAVEGVIPGRCVAFGLEDERAGTEEVCVVVESEREEAAEKARLGRAIQQAGMAIDLTIAKVFVVPPRWLIKSSAGKPSRRDNKERAVRELSPV